MDISIHALREEGDDHLDAAYEPLNQFLSTPSARRATIKKAQEPDNVQFLSTPSARRATMRVPPAFVALAISIHALREEGDRRKSICGGLA